MAAVAEIGEKVLGPGDGTAAPQAAVSISGPFLKLIYDALLPINTIQAWDSKNGSVLFTDQIPSFPEFSSVDWQRCDQTGTGGAPDLSLQAISGANFVAGPDQSFTGDQKAAEDMGPAGGFTPAGTVDPTALAIGELPKHTPLFTGTPMANHEHNRGGAQQVDFGNQVEVQTDNNNGSAGELKSAGTPAGTIGEIGNDETHTHNFTGNAESDHIHTAGQPASAALEFYIRVA